MARPMPFDKWLTKTHATHKVLLRTAKTMNTTEQHINLEEALEIARVRKTLFYKLIRQKKMPAPIKLGTRSFWYASQIKQSVADLNPQNADNN